MQPIQSSQAGGRTQTLEDLSWGVIETPRTLKSLQLERDQVQGQLQAVASKTFAARNGMTRMNRKGLADNEALQAQLQERFNNLNTAIRTKLDIKD